MINAAPRRHVIDDYSLGWDNVSAPGSMDPRCVADCKNFNIGFRGSLEKRAGMAKLCPTPAATAPVHSLREYPAPDGSVYPLVGVSTFLKTTGGFEVTAPVLSGVELVTNGGFGADTVGWTAGGPTTLSSVAGGEAGNCLQIEKSGPGVVDCYAYQDIVGLTIDQTYQFSFYVKKGTGDHFKGYVACNSVNYGPTEDSRDAPAGWTQHKIVFKAGATTATIYLRLYLPGPAGETMLFDTVSLQAVTNTPDNLVDFIHSNNYEYWGYVPGGSYTAATIATAVKNAMDAVSGGAYTCSYSATTKKFTTSQAAVFKIPWHTGLSKEYDVSALLGYSEEADDEGWASYTGDWEVTGNTWVTLKSGLTNGTKMSFAQLKGYMFVSNGLDDNFKLYNTTAYGVGIAPPAAKPTVAPQAGGSLTGKYRYVYCYRRTTNEFTGNPSPVSDEVTVAAQYARVTYVASADPQVNKIAIFRTLNLLGDGADSTQWYFVVERDNANDVYDDETADNALTSLCEIDNTVPPKAKFVCLHKDRVVYANIPVAVGNPLTGPSCLRWSKQGVGDAAPSTNYQFFDRDDGQEITGIGSVGDYLIVFKKNKIAVLAGDLLSAATTQFYPIHHSVGCIAPWAIIQLEDKVVFLSEEGWKACNGREVFPYSERINSVVEDGYCSWAQAANISAAYYPAREQFHYLINHSTLAKRVFVGHFILPLMILTGEIPEQKTEHLVGWTYHQYDSHTLTCIGTFTAASGITRIMAGDSNGYIYRLDTGSDDDGSNIHALMKTDATPLGAPHELTKVLRFLYVSYITDTEEAQQIKVTTDVDDYPGSAIDYVIGTYAAFCGYCYCGYAYCGVDGSLMELIRLALTGRTFRVTVEQNNKFALTVKSLMFRYRLKGLRE